MELVDNFNNLLEKKHTHRNKHTSHTFIITNFDNFIFFSFLFFSFVLIEKGEGSSKENWNSWYDEAAIHWRKLKWCYFHQKGKAEFGAKAEAEAEGCENIEGRSTKEFWISGSHNKMGNFWLAIYIIITFKNKKKSNM